MRGGHAEAGSDIGGYRLHLGPEPGPDDLAAIDAGFRHEPGHVGGDGKADADRAAGLRIDGGIDADELAVEIDQGAARIAGIDGSIGLDEEFVVRFFDAGAGQCRDDA
jgi:hypothetical protein